MSFDLQYRLLFAGQTEASADTAHSVYGGYGGLSDLGADDDLYVEVMGSKNNAVLLATNGAAGFGRMLSSSMVDYALLPHTDVASASELHFKNQVAGSNSVVNYAIWLKK